MAKSIIIIGGGIAGLAAGCYGQMNGYRTKIFELHDLPGGLCTSWKRKGYTIDGCIHWLIGSTPSNSFYQIWKELGAVQGREMVYGEEFFRIEGKEGKTLIVYADADRLGKHLKDLAPEDAKEIEQLAKAIRDVSRVQMPMDSGIISNAKMFLSFLPVLRHFRRYGKLSIAEYARRFKNPFLRESFAQFFDIPDFPMVALIMTLDWKHSRDGGYPIGGSLSFAQSIEQRYLKLGGEIKYKSRVAKIITENNCAIGVQLTDGSENRADLIISAADGHATIFDMLEGRYVNDEIKRNYQEMPIFQPLVYVSLGVNMDFSSEPHSVTFPVPQPIDIAGALRRQVTVRHYCYDPTLSPPGKSVLVVSFFSNIDYWNNLGPATEAYQKEKEKILASVVSVLEQRFPGIKDRIEITDVATPITFERYTGNWQGSMEGWLITPKTATKQMPKTLPGLQNMYMIGQWVHPGGGLPPAAKSGRDVIKKICREDKKKFCTTVPANL